MINILVGSLTLLAALQQAFSAGADAVSIKNAAFSLLFAFTYLWVAFNRFSGDDGRGLGWFSLFVALTAVSVAFDTLRAACGTSGSACRRHYGLSCGCCFFLLLALQKPVTHLTAQMSIAAGVLTGWLPGYSLLTGVLMA